MTEIQKHSQLDLGVGPALVGDLFQPGIRKDQERLVSQIVSTSCEERFDALGILEVVNFAYLFSESNAHDDKQRIRSERKRDAIFKGIDQYFVKNRTTYKTLLPGTADLASECSDFLHYTGHLSDPTFQKTIEQYRGLDAFMQELVFGRLQLIEAIGKGDLEHASNADVVIIVDRTKYLINPNYEKWEKKANEIYAITQQAKDTYTSQKTLNWMADMHRLHIDGLPDYFTDVHGKYALSDIVTESNTSTALTMLLDVIPHLPKGDVMWQRVIANTFFSFPYEHDESGKPVHFKIPEVMEKLYSMQLHMAEGVFMPIFLKTPVDKSFDRSITRVLEVLDDYDITSLAFCVYGGGLINALAMQKMFHPGKSLQQFRDTYPVIDLLVKQADRYPPSYRSSLFALTTALYFTDHLQQITSSLRERFGNSKKVERLIATITHYASVDFKKYEAELFSSAYLHDGGLTGEASSIFYLTLRKNKEIYGSALGDKSMVQKDLQMSWTADTDPDGDDEGALEEHIVCRFSEDSFLYKGGFSYITFTSFEPNPSVLYFKLETKQFSGYIIGTIVQNETDGSLVVDLPSTTFVQGNDFLKLVTHYIATGTYSHLLQVAGLADSTQGVTVNKLIDNIKKRSTFDSPEAVEQAAYAFFRQHGGISDRLLERSGEKGLRDAIHERFDMRELKETLQKRSESSQTPEEVNQMVTSLLEKLDN